MQQALIAQENETGRNTGASTWLVMGMKIQETQ